MNRKQLSLILGLVVILGGLGLWLNQRGRSSFSTGSHRMGEKVLGDFDVNAVAGMVIRQGTNLVELAKKEEQWVVLQRGGYPANFAEVSELVRKLWGLKVVQPVEVGPSQLARLELQSSAAAESSGTSVELMDKEAKPIRSLLLGKKHVRAGAQPSPLGGDEGWPDGRYVMPDGKADAVSLVSESFSNVEPKPEQWLNKDFFKIEKVKSISVTYASPTNSFSLRRETDAGDWELIDAAPTEQLDKSKASAVPSAMAWPSFTDVVVDPQPEVTGLATPTVATLETFDGLTYTIRTGNKSGEEAVYLSMSLTADLPKQRTPGADEKPEDKERLDKEFEEKLGKLREKVAHEQSLGQWTYLVSKWTVDGLLKQRHDLLAGNEPVSPPGGGQDQNPTPFMDGGVMDEEPESVQPPFAPVE